MRLAAAILLLLLSGCIRLGSGDDLHLVCEEKSASPRKAYDIGFLVAQTRMADGIEEKEQVAMLEAARHHVITPGGRPHSGFRASLAPAEDVEGPMWTFTAVGGNGERPADHYRVHLWKEGSTWAAGGEPGVRGLVRPPHSIAQPAWDIANATSAVTSAKPQESTPREPTWEPALPSCVRVGYDGESDGLEVVVNVVQARVVSLREL